MQCQMRSRKSAERNDNNHGTLGAQFAILPLVKPIFESAIIDITVITLSLKLHQPTILVPPVVFKIIALGSLCRLLIVLLM